MRGIRGLLIGVLAVFITRVLDAVKLPSGKTSEKKPLNSSSLFQLNDLFGRPAHGFGRSARSNNLATVVSYWDFIETFVSVAGSSTTKQLKLDEPIVNIVEIGAGFGGFSFLMVKEGLRRFEESRGPGIAFRYVLTDHRDQVIQSAMQHPKLRTLSAATPWFDYASFDLFKDTEINLRLSGAPLDKNTPTVFISHSVMCELPFDFVKLDLERDETRDTYIKLNVGATKYDQDECPQAFVDSRHDGAVQVKVSYERSATSRLKELQQTMPLEQIRSGGVQVPFAAMHGFGNLARSFPKQLLLVFDEISSPGETRPLEELFNFDHVTMMSWPVNILAVQHRLELEGMQLIGNSRLEVGVAFLGFTNIPEAHKALTPSMGSTLQKLFDKEFDEDLSLRLPESAELLDDDVRLGLLSHLGLDKFPVFYELSHKHFQSGTAMLAASLWDLAVDETEGPSMASAAFELAEWICNWTFPLDSLHRCEPELVAMADLGLSPARSDRLRVLSDALWGDEQDSADCENEFWRSTACTTCSMKEPGQGGLMTSVPATVRPIKIIFKNSFHAPIWLARGNTEGASPLISILASSTRIMQTFPGDEIMVLDGVSADASLLKVISIQEEHRTAGVVDVGNADKQPTDPIGRDSDYGTRNEF